MFHKILCISISLFTFNQIAFSGLLIDFDHNKFGTKWPSPNIPVSYYWNLFPNETAAIKSALVLIEKESCLRFSETPHHLCGPGCIMYARLENSTACESNVGMQRREYNLVKGGAPCFQVLGKIIHETLHSIGFLHEHQRPDRRKYIRVVWENVKRYKNPQFTIKTVNVSTLNTKYDYGSIMHYGTAKFSKYENVRTIEPLQAEYAALMGQRHGLSQGDIQTINIAYCGWKN